MLRERHMLFNAFRLPLLVVLLAAMGQVRINAAVSVAETNAQAGSFTSPNQVTVAWDPSPDASVTGYFLYYGTDGSSLTNRLDVGNQTNAPLAGLQPGLTYQLTVTAYDASGSESDPSNQIQYKVPVAPPQNLAVQPLNQQEHVMNLSFQGVAGATYQIEATTDLVNWSLVLTTNCVATGPFTVSVADTTANPSQFFRMVQN